MACQDVFGKILPEKPHIFIFKSLKNGFKDAIIKPFLNLKYHLIKTINLK